MFYRWYVIDEDNPDLASSLQLIKSRKDMPPLRIASFDLETIHKTPGQERIPTGHDPDDAIVMISLAMAQLMPNGDLQQGEKHLLYLNPLPHTRLDIPPFPTFSLVEHANELDMLNHFFKLVQPAHIITGYNINFFDIPCLFARSLFLDRRLSDIFSSQKIGRDIVPTFQGKQTLDYYAFVRNFSPYGLPGFKLDDVAKTRIGESKVPVRAVAIHKWYQATDRLTPDVLKSNDLALCYRIVEPGFPENEFGTFLDCLRYCMIDSELVLKLLAHEKAVPFLMTRANVSTLNAEEVLYYGNSRYIENVACTYGTLLGFYVPLGYFRNVSSDGDYDFESRARVNERNKYQGALNYCEKPGFYENISDYDFESLYPSTILCCNVSYESFAVLHVSSLQKLPSLDSYRIVPYKLHTDEDFQRPSPVGEKFAFPIVTADDQLVMVWHKHHQGFIPVLLNHFLAKRRKAKAVLKIAYNTSDYNKQLAYKLFLNSIYGVFGSSDLRMSNFGLGMSVTCLARMILLGAYHYLKSRDVDVFYCDTDSLFASNCHVGNEEVNRYFDSEKSINLQLNDTYDYMLLLTKKRYVYEKKNKVYTKGFEVRSNQLIKTMLNKVLHECFRALKSGDHTDASDGWILWTTVLRDAVLGSRNPGHYFTTRKVKSLEEYAAKCSAPHVRMMKRHCAARDPTDFVQFTYLRADVSKQHWQSVINPVYVDQCEEHDEIDFEKLFVSQKKNLLTLLNLAFFHYPNYRELLFHADQVIQTFRWKSIMQAALMYRVRRGEDVLVLTEKNTAYTFKKRKYSDK